MAAPKKRVSKSKTKIRKNVWKKKAIKQVNKIFPEQINKNRSKKDSSLKSEKKPFKGFGDPSKKRVSKSKTKTRKKVWKKKS